MISITTGHSPSLRSLFATPVDLQAWPPSEREDLSIQEAITATPTVDASVAAPNYTSFSKNKLNFTNSQLRNYSHIYNHEKKKDSIVNHALTLQISFPGDSAADNEIEAQL